MPAHPVRVAATGLVCAAGREREAVVAALRAGRTEPVTLELGGLDSRFLYSPVPEGLVPAGEARLEALLEGAVGDALEAACLGDAERRELAVFAGSSSLDMGPLEARARRLGGEPPLGPRTLIADRIAERFGLGGRRLVFSSACTSAANALFSAMEQISSGRLERVLVVGVECFNALSLHGFNSLGLLSANGCRPFDRHRSGMVLGEGAAALLLERGEGETRLLGGANGSDPGHLTRPAVEGMHATLRAALSDAGVEPAEVSAVKAHGTATEANDAAEAEALRRLFDGLPPVSSLKPQLGYTLGANMALELVAWLWCVQAGFLPGTPNFREADPEAPLRPLMKPLDCEDGVFLLNCFGFGGNNTCLVMRHG